ncbi:hypothetical protein [Streptococcus halichoeri]|uniref:hypothetical protein n=1 Tax=Streptococcus halichoeri TaxID=254785 RepID=UPI0013581C9A|nr:hypothetical protein [Streptococcus halichoeri]
MVIKTRLNKLRIVRFFTGQLPVIISFLILFLNINDLQKMTVTNTIIVFYLLFSAMLSNYFLTKEIREEKVKNNLSSSILFSQFILIAIFITLGIVCIYRFFCVDNIELYQKVLTSIVGIISIVFSLLLIWGIKYINKSEKLQSK